MARRGIKIASWLVWVCLTMHLMSSCVLKKMLTHEVDTEDFSESAYWQRVISNAPAFDEFSACFTISDGIAITGKDVLSFADGTELNAQTVQLQRPPVFSGM